MSDDGPQRTTNRGRPMTIVGFVLAAIAVFFLPIILGPAAAIFGGVGYGKGDRLGMWAIVAGVAATIVGMLLGVLVLQEAQS